MKASLKNYRQSPRKVRLVADLVRGKSVKDAKAELRFSTKRASKQVGKILDSATANAVRNFNAKEDELVVKSVRVDKGYTLRRMRAGARGRGFPINKRTSHIVMELGVKEDKKEKKEDTKAPVNKKSAKKAETKKVDTKKEVKKEEK